MKVWTKYGVGLVAVAGLTPGLMAQLPGPVPGPAPAPLPAGAPGAVPPKKLLNFLGLGPEQRAACREKICQTQLGKLLNNASKPLGAVTGGLVPGFCPLVPSLAELNSENPAVKSAAEIKKAEAEAAARRAAVRYLGTVDCHYWPEAEGALIKALRTDTNECVRLEAALALGNGCCCTKKTIKALHIAATCSDEDDNPTETSERVRSAAFNALQHCLACFQDKVPEKKGDKGSGDPKPPGGEPGPKTAVKQDKDGRAHLYLTAYYVKVDETPAEEVVDGVRKTLAQMGTFTARGTYLPTGSRSVFHIVRNAVGGQQVGSAPAQEVSRGVPVKDARPVIIDVPLPREGVPGSMTPVTAPDGTPVELDTPLPKAELPPAPPVTPKMEVPATPPAAKQGAWGPRSSPYSQIGPETTLPKAELPPPAYGKPDTSVPRPSPYGPINR